MSAMSSAGGGGAVTTTVISLPLPGGKPKLKEISSEITIIEMKNVLDHFRLGTFLGFKNSCC